MSEATLSTTCGYCSTGCSLSVTVEDGVPTKVAANPNYPVNRGKACPKGFQFLGHLGSSDRALTPLARDPSGRYRPLDWDAALDMFTRNFKGLQKRYGPESVAFIGTGQVSSEEHAFLGALAKFGMGFVNGDGNTRQCMSTAAVAHKQSFGFDAPPFTYADLEESDVLVFVGANPAIAHPIMWQRIRSNPHKPKIVVIDPRSTETVRAASAEHFQLAPKSDLCLLYGIAQALVSQGWIDEAFISEHTSGFGAFRAHLAEFTLARVSHDTGLSHERISRLAEVIHEGERVSFWWTMGVNQGFQAVRTAQAIINLALMTGNIGRPGTGANSITGQCNAMGARLFNNTSSLFCGRDFANADHRAEIAAILGIEESLIPDQPSLFYHQILEAVDSGQIKGLWIICTNPTHSWVDRVGLERILDKLEFLVVQDMFSNTETARHAHLILPAAGCGEKDGTFINSERRIGCVRKIQEPPGLALTDFQIFQMIAEHWGCGDLFRDWVTPEACFHILKRLSKGTQCDFSGVRDYADLQEKGGVQWPCPEGSKALDPERRLFADGRFFHADGRARFMFEGPVKPPERPDADYPLILNTGRGSVAQWHTLTRTDKAPLLKRVSPDPAYVEMSRDDAEAMGVGPEAWVEVRSRRGVAVAKVRITDNVRPGQVFMSMHYSQTNNLTIRSFDPYSGQPSFKHAAVTVKSAAVDDQAGGQDG